MVETAVREPVGREVEVAALERFSAGLHHGSAAALVRGEAGIGKTTLWRRALVAAEVSGVLVLATACVEAEMPIAMCGLADLLDPVLDEVVDDLPTAQCEALSRALGLETRERSAADHIALPRAVTAALGALAESRPLLIAVDDAQWLDPASARLVAFALRRLVDRPVGALVTVRGTGPDPLALHRCFGRERFEELRLGPLSAGALGHLLRSYLDVHVPRPTLARIHAVSAGNPMYALELARALPRRGVTRALTQLPLPASLEELMRAHVERLPTELGALLETVAALERPTPAFLERAVDDAAARLDLAIEREALVDDEGIIRFTHPLLASAVYARIPRSRRQRLHARLSALIDDPEARAAHRALAAEPPDPDVADELDDAARHAAARGAPDAAAILVEYARRLSPPDDATGHAERLLAEAGYLADFDEHGRARELVDDLLGTPLAGPQRARALQLRYVLSPPPNVRAGLALLEQALEHTGDDRRLRVRLLCSLAYAHGYVGEYRPGEQRAREAVALARSVGDAPLTGLAVDAQFHISTVRGAPSSAAFHELLEVGRPALVSGEFAPSVILSRERRCAGDLDTARALLEQEAARCEERGAEYPRAASLYELADVELRAGNWRLAGSLLDEALGIHIDGQDYFGQAVTRSSQALLAAHRGDVAQARALAEAAIAVADDWGWEEFAIRNRWILGFVELSLGEPRRAWRHLAALPERLADMGIGEPGHLPALPDVVETLAALGRLDIADGVLAQLECSARALAHRWATPAALRCRALLALARGASEDALEFAEQAVAGFEAAGFPFDHGRSLMAQGDALRRLGRRRRAAQSLEQARDEFERLGAQLWHARAEQELRRAAPRRANSGELTAAERRVAALVAAGRTNREVAAELFTTVSTVEAHLTRIYRKLDVRSRTELVRRLV